MASVWAKATNYTYGHIVVNTPGMGKQWYMCIKAGRSRNGGSPFSNANDSKGDEIVDYQIIWLCMGDGGVGNCKFTYSGTSAVLAGENLEVKFTYGNPNMRITKRSGTKDGPRSMVAYIGEEIYQITGILNGPGTPGDIADFKSVFKNRFKTNKIDMYLTGDNATKYGASLTVMHSGSNALKITPLRGHRWMHVVDIQVLLVDNS